MLRSAKILTLCLLGSAAGMLSSGLVTAAPPADVPAPQEAASTTPQAAPVQEQQTIMTHGVVIGPRFAPAVVPTQDLPVIVPNGVGIGVGIGSPFAGDFILPPPPVAFGRFPPPIMGMSPEQFVFGFTGIPPMKMLPMKMLPMKMLPMKMLPMQMDAGSLRTNDQVVSDGLGRKWLIRERTWTSQGAICHDVRHMPYQPLAPAPLAVPPTQGDQPVAAPLTIPPPPAPTATHPIPPAEVTSAPMLDPQQSGTMKSQQKLQLTTPQPQPAPAATQALPAATQPVRAEMQLVPSMVGIGVGVDSQFGTRVFKYGNGHASAMTSGPAGTHFYSTMSDGLPGGTAVIMGGDNGGLRFYKYRQEGTAEPQTRVQPQTIVEPKIDNKPQIEVTPKIDNEGQADTQPTAPDRIPGKVSRPRMVSTPIAPKEAENQPTPAPPAPEV